MTDQPQFVATTVETTWKDPTPEPYVFIQWKNTHACIQLNCVCGADEHFDGYFGYQLRCVGCGRIYAMPTSIHPVEIKGVDEWANPMDVPGEDEFGGGHEEGPDIEGPVDVTDQPSLTIKIETSGGNVLVSVSTPNSNSYDSWASAEGVPERVRQLLDRGIRG